MRFFGTFLLLFAMHAFATEQEPPGSTTSFTINTNNPNNRTIDFTNHTSGSNWTVNMGPRPIDLPYTYKDPDSGVIFYVESDGRHISAINNDGKILWTRDPFADAHLEFYRTRTPRIVYFNKIEDAQKWMEKGMAGKGSGKYIAISYSSSQCGVLDQKTGDFTFAGQN